MFKSEIKDYNLDLFVSNLTTDLIGFVSIGLVLLFTLFIALRWPAISKIIFGHGKGLLHLQLIQTKC